jgi:hypothetical protein
MDTSPRTSVSNSSGVHAAAVRRAREATSRRDAERIRRECELEAALVDFYAALARIEKVRAKAARDVEPFEHSADEAVRRMAQLGEPVAAIAELTKLPSSQVRMALAGAKGRADGPSSAGPTGEAASADVAPGASDSVA